MKRHVADCLCGNYSPKQVQEMLASMQLAEREATEARIVEWLGHRINNYYTNHGIAQNVARAIKELIEKGAHRGGK